MNRKTNAYSDYHERYNLTSGTYNRPAVNSAIVRYEHFQRNYIELMELNDEYEALVADEEFEAEYLNIIEFEDKVLVQA